MTPPKPVRTPCIPAVSPAAAGPLYQQIVDGVKREVSAGRLAPGMALPSFRSLAKQLMVSVITVKKAYEMLEAEGVLFRKQGLGTFIAERALDQAQTAKQARVRALLAEAAREAVEAGMDWIEVHDLLDEAWAQQGSEAEHHVERSIDG